MVSETPATARLSHDLLARRRRWRQLQPRPPHIPSLARCTRRAASSAARGDAPRARRGSSCSLAAPPRPRASGPEVSPAAPRVGSPHAPRRGRRPTRARPALRAPAPGAAEARAGHCPPPYAAGGCSAPCVAGPGGRGAGRGPGGGVRAARSREAAAAARADTGSPPRPGRRGPSPCPDALILLLPTNPSTCAPPPVPGGQLLRGRLLAAVSCREGAAGAAAATVVAVGASERGVLAACPWLAGLVWDLLPRPTPEHYARVNCVSPWTVRVGCGFLVVLQLSLRNAGLKPPLPAERPASEPAAATCRRKVDGRDVLTRGRRRLPGYLGSKGQFSSVTLASY
ncbi:translation initiation factor IF-2-like [Nycticebus coucang]|uniref:translation initiation factor IF-2-like n=1 Tax=Nycticebus coucang TaxID=9470 RepID=UPI00234C7FBA|nr:translation initiation factor IF-2-like [Nycticebus coucang]